MRHALGGRWQRPALAFLPGLLWVACGLNPQPIPPGDTGDDAGTVDMPGNGGSGPGFGNYKDGGGHDAGTIIDGGTTFAGDAGDAGDASGDANDGGDASDGDADGRD